MAENGKLSTKKHKAVAALLTESTQEAAAKKAGVGHRTLCRWLAEDSVFQEALAEAENEAISQAARLVAGNINDAIETLLDIMRTDKMTKERRLAAKHIIDSLSNLRLLGSIEQRLSQLEQKQNDDS